MSETTQRYTVNLLVSVLLAIIGWLSVELYQQIQDTKVTIVTTQERLNNTITMWRESQGQNMDDIKYLKSHMASLEKKISRVEVLLEVNLGKQKRLALNQTTIKSDNNNAKFIFKTMQKNRLP